MLTLEVNVWGAILFTDASIGRCTFKPGGHFGGPGLRVPLTRTGLASVQDSGDLRVVTQPADGPQAGLGMLDVSLKISFRDQAPPSRPKGRAV